MNEPAESALIFEVDLDPADLTLFEWHELQAYLCARTDHVNFCAVGHDVAYDTVLRVAAEDRLRTVGRDDSGWIEVRGDVPESWRDGPGEWSWLEANTGRNGKPHFNMLDVRAYCGDLAFVVVHDNELRLLHAVREELPFYYGFGLDDRAFRPANDLRVRDTWAHTQTLDSILGDEPGYPDRQVGNRRLDPAEVAAMYVDLVARYPVVPPPFDLMPEQGVSRRAFERWRLTWLHRLRREVAMKAGVASGSLISLDGVRREGTRRFIGALEALRYPRPTADAALSQQLAPDVGSLADILRPRPRGYGGEAWYSDPGPFWRSGGYVNLADGRVFRYIVHVAFAERFACGYRLEAADGRLIWQMDDCPVTAGPHRHWADGSIEALAALPEPMEAVREAAGMAGERQ